MSYTESHQSDQTQAAGIFGVQKGSTHLTSAASQETTNLQRTCFILSLCHSLFPRGSPVCTIIINFKAVMEKRSLPKGIMGWKLLLYISPALILTTAVGSLFFNAGRYTILETWRPPSCLKSSFESQDEPRIRSVFTSIPFVEDLESAHETKWTSKFSTKQGGFLVVRRNETYTENWGVTMYHSLHCLMLIRTALGHAIATGKHDSQHELRHEGMEYQGADTSESGHTAHAADVKHLEHCLSYIAQVC